VPRPSPGPKQERPYRRQVSWLAGRRSRHGLPGSGEPLPVAAFPQGEGMCPSLAAYSCRDSRGIGAEAPHRIPVYAPLRGAPTRSWHRIPAPPGDLAGSAGFANDAGVTVGRPLGTVTYTDPFRVDLLALTIRARRSRKASPEPSCAVLQDCRSRRRIMLAAAPPCCLNARRGLPYGRRSAG